MEIFLIIFIPVFPFVVGFLAGALVAKDYYDIED